MNQKLPGCVVFPQLHVFIAVLAMKPYISLKGLNTFFFFLFFFCFANLNHRDL